MKRMKKDVIVTVKYILGETAEPLLTQLSDGKFRFNCDAYVIGEKCKDGFYHLRQAREIIPGKKLGNNVRFWPRLRKALQLAGIRPVNIPGGDDPIHYSDEIVIPDFAVSGSHYFVIKKSDIGKYLDMLPLDEAGKARAEDIAKRKAEAEAEAYRQAHDPACISERIGNKIWYGGGYGLSGEFKKVTLISENNEEFSVIYPNWETDLIWSGYSNVPKVVCEAPETGIEYLSGWAAGHLDPKKHVRIKKFPSVGWQKYVAYLMPNPELADEVRETDCWLDMFRDGSVPFEKIANAKKIILESYDLDDKLLKERYVYDSASGSVTKEYLHNWPFNVSNEVIGEFDWSTEL